MKTQTKKTIRIVINSMLFVAMILLTVSFCLFSFRMGFGFKMEPPFCWASFLQMGLFMLTSWAFNKELFYY
jgi:hypothetical protein